MSAMHLRRTALEIYERSLQIERLDEQLEMEISLSNEAIKAEELLARMIEIADLLTDQIFGDRKPSTKYLNVYRISRHYGGPEEGGWWYDAGELVQSHLLVAKDDASLSELIYNTRKRLEEEFPRSGKRYSVLGGDDYDIHVGEERGEDWSNYAPWE